MRWPFRRRRPRDTVAGTSRAAVSATDSLPAVPARPGWTRVSPLTTTVTLVPPTLSPVLRMPDVAATRPMLTFPELRHPRPPVDHSAGRVTGIAVPVSLPVDEPFDIPAAPTVSVPQPIHVEPLPMPHPEPVNLGTVEPVAAPTSQPRVVTYDRPVVEAPVLTRAVDQYVGAPIVSAAAPSPPELGMEPDLAQVMERVTGMPVSGMDTDTMMSLLSGFSSVAAAPPPLHLDAPAPAEQAPAESAQRPAVRPTLGQSRRRGVGLPTRADEPAPEPTIVEAPPADSAEPESTPPTPAEPVVIASWTPEEPLPIGAWQTETPPAEPIRIEPEPVVSTPIEPEPVVPQATVEQIDEPTIVDSPPTVIAPIETPPAPRRIGLGAPLTNLPPSDTTPPRPPMPRVTTPPQPVPPVSTVDTRPVSTPTPPVVPDALRTTFPPLIPRPVDPPSPPPFPVPESPPEPPVQAKPPEPPINYTAPEPVMAEPPPEPVDTRPIVPAEPVDRTTVVDHPPTVAAPTTITMPTPTIAPVPIVGPVYRAALDVLPPPVPAAPSTATTTTTTATMTATMPTTATAPGDLAVAVRSVVGVDVSDVPVRRGPEVSAAARTLNARAFTTRGEVHLPAEVGQFDNPQARGLLAHELVHAAQQRMLGSALPDESSAEGELLEREAVATEMWVRGDAPQPPALVHRPPSQESVLMQATMDETRRLAEQVDRLAAERGDGAGFQSQSSFSSAVQRAEGDSPTTTMTVEQAPNMETMFAHATTTTTTQQPQHPPTTAHGYGDESPQQPTGTDHSADIATLQKTLAELTESISGLTGGTGDQEIPDLADHATLDRLATRLFSRIRSQLRRELLVDRERVGRLSDFG